MNDEVRDVVETGFDVFVVWLLNALGLAIGSSFMEVQADPLAVAWAACVPAAYRAVLFLAERRELPTNGPSDDG